MLCLCPQPLYPPPDTHTHTHHIPHTSHTVITHTADTPTRSHSLTHSYFWSSLPYCLPVRPPSHHLFSAAKASAGCAGRDWLLRKYIWCGHAQSCMQSAHCGSPHILHPHITSHHITHVESHQIPSHHITSHHITSHHTTSYVLEICGYIYVSKLKTKYPLRLFSARRHAHITCDCPNASNRTHSTILGFRAHRLFKWQKK